MGGIGGVEDQGPLLADQAGGAEVDRGGRVIPDARVPVLVVVVVQPGAHEGARVLGVGEAAREVRGVLERLEPRLVVGVVVPLTG